MTAVFPSVNIIISGALPNIQIRYNRSVIANKQDCHQHKPAIYRPLELSTNLREVCLKNPLRYYAKQALQSGKYIDVKMEGSVLTKAPICCDLCGQVFPQFHNTVFKSSLNAHFGHSETSRMFIDSSNKSQLFTVTVTGLHTAPRDDDDTCNFVKLPEFITLASAGHRGLPGGANGA